MSTHSPELSPRAPVHAESAYACRCFDGFTHQSLYKSGATQTFRLVANAPKGVCPWVEAPDGPPKPKKKGKK